MASELLVRTPAPRAGESLHGYVLRVSEANGYDTPWQVMAHAGINGKEAASARFPVRKLAAILGISTTDLEGIAYVTCTDNPARHFKILGHSLGTSLKTRLLRFKKPAFCVQCAQEDGHIDAFWDLKVAVACSIHRCHALEACPACGRPLSWFRGGLLTCRCGESLARAETDTASSALAGLMALLRAKLHCKAASQLPEMIGFPTHELEALELRYLLMVLWRLGQFNLLSQGRTSQSALATMEAAADTLRDWPNGYRQFLARLGTALQAQSAGAIGLRRQFSRFYEPMFKSIALSKSISFLRDEFVNFGLTGWGYAVVDKKLLRGDTGKGSRYLSNTAVANQIGIRPITLRRWSARGHVPVHRVAVGSQVRYVFDSETIEMAKLQPGKVLQTRKAAAAIDLPTSVLSALKRSGHFTMRNMPKYKPGFHETDLENFRQRMLEQSPVINQNETGVEPLVSLQYVLQEVRFWSKTGKADFVTSYLDGTTRSVGRTGGSWKNIMFRSADVEEFAGRCRTTASVGAVSQAEAALAIGCDIQAIPTLLAKGYLDSSPGPARTRVESQSLEQFLSRYASLASIARQTDTTVSRLIRLCRKTNIRILEAPRKQGSVIPFIELQDQENLLEAERLNPTREKRREFRLSRIPRLRRYFEELATDSIPFPRHAGQLNKSAIAKACGFDRDFLSRGSEAAEATMIMAAFDAADRERHKIPPRLPPAVAVDKFLKKIAVAKSRPPRRAGRLNRAAVAKACNLNRNVLYKDAEAMNLLSEFDAQQGKWSPSANG